MSRGAPFRLPTSARSSAILSWEAVSGTLLARTGQVPVFERGGTKTAHDSAGAAFTVTEDVPRWSVEQSAFGLLLENGETFAWPLEALPQSLTLYVQWVETGAADNDNVLVGVGGIGDSSFTLATDGGTAILATFTDPVSATYVATATAHPSTGEVVEARATLTGGALTCTCGVSRNGGTETTGTVTGPAALPTSWGSAALLLGPDTNGTALWQKVKLFPGVLTMAQCRSRV